MSSTETAPSTATTNHDDLPVPGGHCLRDLSDGELARLGDEHHIPGINHSNGRAANAQAYATFLAGFRQEAADNAVKAWLDSIPQHDEPHDEHHETADTDAPAKPKRRPKRRRAR